MALPSAKQAAGEVQTTQPRVQTDSGQRPIRTTRKFKLRHYQTKAARSSSGGSRPRTAGFPIGNYGSCHTPCRASLGEDGRKRPSHTSNCQARNPSPCEPCRFACLTALGCLYFIRLPPLPGESALEPARHRTSDYKQRITIIESENRRVAVVESLSLIRNHWRSL
jgi:hypothetical protein